LKIAREMQCPAAAVVMTTPEAICRQRNADRAAGSRLSEERMDRMFAALEPVGADEGFQQIYDGGTITLGEIVAQQNIHREEEVSHEHSHQAR
jgi:hypothetical protein